MLGESWDLAKFTANSQDMKQWCLDMHEKYSKSKKEGRKDTSFGNEQQNEGEAEADPTSNTKNDCLRGRNPIKNNKNFSGL